MKNTNKYKSEANKTATPTLEAIAESWVRLCLYHIRQKKELANQNKKAYEYSTK